ncbi:MAG: acyl-CoA thioesterase II [Austwickia sp.]|nr:acyl-CoA thioesterase II [Austwickia sp.]MBK8434954.1 acyl-CoA thioesterase II [Austwickia sp.]MBK9101488.1 acyl-CoA thioesterase II [Austwickia sp.]
MADPIANLLEVLNLQPAGRAEARLQSDTQVTHYVASDDIFIGRSQPMPHGRVFGGQVLAQVVMAAGLTVADLDGPARALHSMHGYFLRPGDANAPIVFAVERLRDGGSFSARRVHALQDGKPIMSIILSFQIPATGMDHQDEMPEVPRPDSLPTLSETIAASGDRRRGEWITRRAIDIRHCEGPLYATPAPHRQSLQNVWIRAVGRLPDDPLIHQAVLAYAADYTLLESVLRQHGLAWADPRLVPASLDHSMWFHRPAKADDWILYAQRSPSSSGGRGLGIGRMFSADGTLVASVGQEGMLRVRGW